LNPLLRKYRRFLFVQEQQGLGAALKVSWASLANSARYRWLLVRERALAGSGSPGSGKSSVPDNDRYDVLAFLPSADRAQRPVPSGSVAVVIPVYRDLGATRACLTSVLGSQCGCLAEVIVVDDASPDPEVSAYLDEEAAAGRIHLLRSQSNRGFVHSVNWGMEAAGERDVILLNSDTVVAGDWVDRLAAHGARPLVGTVTPFSNNATICSYPTPDGVRELWTGESVDAIDAAFATANAGRRTEIPTAVGFCMFVSRRCLRDVGAFDADGFKRGYGEENDFCLRASRRGWRHLLAADVFVWHRGEVSFGRSAAALQNQALGELRRRYPGYLSDVADHAQRDPARPWRVAATAARFRRGERPVLLMITHALGGGTEKHVLDLWRRYREEARILVLQPTDAGPVRLWSPESREHLDVRWRVGASIESLAALIVSFGVARVHVHHVLGLQFDASNLIERLGVPFDFTLHDYYSICPRIRLSRPTAGYCGGPEDAKCASCLSDAPKAEVVDVALWHARRGWMLSSAERVICPSLDAADRIGDFVHGPELVVALHDTLDHEAFPDPLAPPLAASEPLRVALIGVLSADKGARLVGECARFARQAQVAVRFSLIGFVPDADARFVKDAGLTVSGPYKSEELPQRLVAEAPHVVWFPAVWPETYSFTLSEAMRARLPVLVPDIGAFAERVAGRPWSWITRWDTSPAEFGDVFAGIAADLRRREPVATGEARSALRAGLARSHVRESSASFYDDSYLNPLRVGSAPSSAVEM
jgi:GT2 family glycosyltransferase/glycosyltransferase involved in cell wall biosynthesis